MNERSESITDLAAALVNVQRAIKPVAKSAENPHYKSKYAPLDAIMSEAKQACNDHGIAILQATEAEDSAGFSLVTTLLHQSGQWITGRVRMPLDKQTPQAAGSAITYGRRYGLAALLGIVADEDDDGNAASAPAKVAKAIARTESARPKKKTLQERSDIELLDLREWAAREAKPDLVEKINEEFERRRNAPLSEQPVELAR